jgi:hypothetical protein
MTNRFQNVKELQIATEKHEIVKGLDYSHLSNKRGGWNKRG